MSTAIAFWRFTRIALPLVVDMLRAVFARHNGNQDAALEEVRRITDYGRRGELAEAEFEARIATVDAAQAAKTSEP